jgi:ketosteroid isomerase-like protein
VELARRAYEAFNRGDSKGMVADLAPAFEYVPTGAIPGVRGVYRGSEGFLDFARWLWDQFENPRIEVLKLTEAGDRVLAEVILRGRGKQSGVEVSWDVWNLWTIRDGQVVHGHAFASREEAQEAAGPSE